jgi:alcohol dehydrogenase (cytochrome c)
MKSPNLILLLLILISSISLSGCVDQSQPLAEVVEIKDFSFQPDTITVPVGTTVTWINHDSASHTISSDDGKFDSGTIKNGGEFTFTFSQPGTYSYHCNIHSSMKGVIAVTLAQPATALAVTKSSNTQPTATSTPMVVLTPQDWPNVNYDNTMSRHSPQTTISKDNVNQLQVKWILNTGHTIEDSPLIIGKTGYVQNNAMQVIAFDLDSGLTKWKYDPHISTAPTKIPRFGVSHGMNYDNGILYAPTGPNGTILAIDAEKGTKIWESPIIQPIGEAFTISAPPLIWRDYIIVGSALGDEPPFGVAEKGSVTALSKKDGKIIWQIKTAVGEWVEGKNASQNGGATTWSGGAIDTEKGIVYLPIGNAAPDFTAETRPGPNLYSSHVIAVNITDGKILWATPFVAEGSVLNVTTPDTHDWDTAWGTNLITADLGKGQQKIVIGHDKRGDIIALDADTGKPIWWRNVAVLYRDNVAPAPNGSGEIWPGPGNGIEAYSAADNSTVYVAVSNQGMIYFSGPGTEGHVVPAFDAMPNGMGNGSITALDLKTGEIKWEHKTDFPTWVSPLVTNGVVFSGTITATGTPYPYGDFGGPTDTPLIPSGILMALDADTGKTLWELNLGAPVGIGGPSIGNGMLLVPTGHIQTPNAGGYIVAFGLPGNK